jgi:hypothetical protein
MVLRFCKRSGFTYYISSDTNPFGLEAMMSRRTTLLLLLCTAHASAFKCDIASSRIMFNVGSEDLCNYTIYHFVMFAVCGIIAIVALLVTCKNILCMADRETVEDGLGCAGTCCGLSLLGLEGVWILLFFAICMYVLYIFLRDCLLSFCPRLSTRRVVPVVPLTEIVVEPSQIVPDSQYAQHLEDIVLESPSAPAEIVLAPPSAPPVLAKELTSNEAEQRGEMECPMCLGTSSSIGEIGWTLTECNHVFHTACLRKWTVGNTTCPYCRAELMHSVITTQCNICLDSGDASESDWALTRCGHSFHTDCLRQWTGGYRTCPNCREGLGN